MDKFLGYDPLKRQAETFGTWALAGVQIRVAVCWAVVYAAMWLIAQGALWYLAL